MPEPENRAPQFVYDRESEFLHDEARFARRRRPVADWGGDELFTRMPRRRVTHSGSRTRRFARPEDDVAPAVPLDELAAAEPQAPLGARIGGGRRGAAEDEPQIADFERQAQHGPPTEERQPRRSRAAGRVAERGGGPAPASRPSASGVTGRRTVVIGRSGRPEFPHPDAPFVRRRRPPRTVAERIGGQPERIVGWAFALGLVLILIAIATAQS